MTSFPASSAVCRVGSVPIGADSPLAIIAGPCLLESRELGMEVGKAIELFENIPKIHSMRIVDLARAIGPGCETKEVGIRPGE